jgi:hypothetical protein
MNLRTLVENVRELPDPRRQYGYLGLAERTEYYTAAPKKRV